MSNEIKRTAPDMHQIIADAKKAGKLKMFLSTGKKFTIPTVRLYRQAMLTRNLDGPRKSTRK